MSKGISMDERHKKNSPLVYSDSPEFFRAQISKQKSNDTVEDGAGSPASSSDDKTVRSHIYADRLLPRNY